MTCRVCKARLKKKRGDIEMRFNGKLAIVKDVEYLECDNCGERIYSRQTTAKILKRLKHRSARAYISVPVYSR